MKWKITKTKTNAKEMEIVWFFFLLLLRFMSYKLLFVDNNYADEIRLDRMRVLHA